MAYIIGLLIIVPIMALCAALVYILSRPTRKEQEPPLTPRDLQVLQESAEELVSLITSTADESLKRFDQAREQLQDLVIRAEKAAQFLEARLGTPEMPRDKQTDKLYEAVDLSRAGLDTSDIARQLDMGAGEIELLLNLRPKLEAAKGT